MNARSLSMLVIAMVALPLILGACAEGQNPADSGIQAHPPTWMEPTNENFHGDLVARDDPATCTACHGSDLMGDALAPSCYECHNGPSGHPEGFAEPPDPPHASVVAANGNGSCAQCHGSDYRGGWAEDYASPSDLASCYTCHGMGPSGHPSGWLTPSAGTFHGNAVAAEGTAQCTPCHGDNLRGGTSGVSCYNSCHDGPGGHPEGWIRVSSPNFHGTVVRDESAIPCQQCHGVDYLGGTSGVPCYTGCHDGPSGHPYGWADPPYPPPHGEAVAIGGSVPCQDCHGADLGGGWTGVACSDCH